MFAYARFSEMTKLPNFLCVGAQKSGTSTLFEILRQHPQVFLPDLKEAHFFDFEDRYKKGLDWYKNIFFVKCRGEKAVGEITPDYIYYEEVPKRIYDDLGKDIKLIFIFRNPVDRAYSHYWMSWGRGYEKETFVKAIELEEKRIKKDEFNRTHFSYLDRGYYARQVKRYLEYFPERNMFFIIFEEDFLASRRNIINRLIDFLEINSQINLNVDIKSNPSSIPKIKFVRDFIYKPDLIKKIGRVLIPNEMLRLRILVNLDRMNQKPFKHPPINADLKKSLIKRFFLDDINELALIINRDLSVWTRY